AFPSGRGAIRTGQMARATTRKTVLRARRLRAEMSLPEAMLWNSLQGRPGGVKFRRQHPIGPFVPDFYCPQARLAIEIGGAAHEMGDRPERDAARERWLAERGIGTIRIPASDVLRSAKEVAERIVAACAAAG